MILSILATLVAHPQGPAPSPLRLVVHADSVIVLLTDRPPGAGGGFVVYRSLAGGAGPGARITDHPVMPVSDPVEAAGLVGGDLDAVERATRATDAVQMLRRLEADQFAASILSGLYRGVARALGRVFVDGGATRGVQYTYRVVFTDPRGKETARSVSATVRVLDVPPSPPSAASLKATVGDRRTTLTWSYTRPRVGEDSTVNAIGFVVYRADGAALAFRRVTSAPVLWDENAPVTYTDPDVENGTTYRYRVTTLDLAGRESAPSAPLTVTPADRSAPAPPSDVVAEAESAGVRVVWRLAPEPDAAGYFVERSRTLDGPYLRVTDAPLPVSAPSFTDASAAGGTRYFYRIIAVDRSGNASAPSNPASVAALDRSPLPPGDVMVTPGSRRLLIRWKRSDPRVRGYYIYRAAAGGKDPAARLFSKPLSDTVYLDSAGLHPGARYLLGVSAVDSTGNESSRAEVQALVPDDDPPGPPTGLAAHDVEGRYALVTWSASGAPDVQWYVLTRTTIDTVAGAPIEVARLSARAPFAVRDTTARHGRAYVYRVVAVDSAGNRSAPATDTLRFVRRSPPPAPRHLAARVSGVAIVVSWERVADPELAGYRVYRGLVPTGEFHPVGSRLVTGTTIADTTARRDYYYRVRAVDRSGNESVPSPAARAVP